MPAAIAARLAADAHRRHDRPADGGGERGDPETGREGGADQRGEARHRRGPHERAGDVEEREARPRHRARAGEHRDDDADARDEAAEEDGLRAVAAEKALTMRQRVRAVGGKWAAMEEDRASSA